MELDAHEAQHLSNTMLLNSKEEETKSSLRLIADGLADGFISKANAGTGTLCAETAIAGGVGGALSLMSQAGGRLGCAARIIGGTLAVGFAADIYRRSDNIYDAYINTSNNFEGQAARQKAIADNAGTALFDYPLMALAGMGAARLVSGPRAVTQSMNNFAETRATPGMSEAAIKWQEFNGKPSVIEWRPGHSAVERPDLVGSKTAWTDGYSEVIGRHDWRPGSKLQTEIDAARKIDWNLTTEITFPKENSSLIAKTNTRSFDEPLGFADHVHRVQNQLEPILRETPISPAEHYGFRVTEVITTGTGVKKTNVLFDRPVSISEALVSYRAINESFDPHAYKFVPGVSQASRVNLHHGEVIHPPAELTAEQSTFGMMWRLNDFWKSVQSEPQLVLPRAPGVSMILNQVHDGSPLKTVRTNDH